MSTGTKAKKKRRISIQDKQILALTSARLTPIHWATYVSRKHNLPWRPYKHIRLFNQKICAKLIPELRKPGDKPFLAIAVAPRYGKSEFADYHVPTWYLGTNPTKSVILATHEASLARRFSASSRDTLRAEGPGMFGVAIGREETRDWGVKLLPHCPHAEKVSPLQKPGGMLAVGSKGPLAGRGAHLFVIDDPFKNAADAFSAAVREAMYNFVTVTAKSRLEPDATMILLMHRWHHDDVIGRLKLHNADEWDFLDIPEICEDPDIDPLHRKRGEVIWPERWTAESVLNKRANMARYWWRSLHQQSPPDPSEKYFKRDLMIIVPTIDGTVVDSVRAWDMADLGEAFTVGSRVDRVESGKRFVTDVQRGDWPVEKAAKIIVETAKKDGPRVRVRVEQEGGSQGRLSIFMLQQQLNGFDFEGVKPVVQKEVRWLFLAGFYQRGDVLMIGAHWNKDVIDELISLPHGATKDIADSLALAMQTLDDKDISRPLITVL